MKKNRVILQIVFLTLLVGMLPNASAADGIVQPRVALFLSKSEQMIDGAGGTYVVSVSASSSWTATANVSWISFIVGSGTGNGDLHLHFAIAKTIGSKKLSP